MWAWVIVLTWFVIAGRDQAVGGSFPPGVEHFNPSLGPVMNIATYDEEVASGFATQRRHTKGICIASLSSGMVFVPIPKCASGTVKALMLQLIRSRKKEEEAMRALQGGHTSSKLHSLLHCGYNSLPESTCSKEVNSNGTVQIGSCTRSLLPHAMTGQDLFPRDQQWFSFSFVRDPLDRFLSGFAEIEKRLHWHTLVQNGTLNKYENLADVYYHENKAKKYVQLPLGTFERFEAFVGDVEASGPWDPHITPQVK